MGLPSHTAALSASSHALPSSYVVDLQGSMEDATSGKQGRKGWGFLELPLKKNGEIAGT